MTGMLIIIIGCVILKALGVPIGKFMFQLLFTLTLIGVICYFTAYFNAPPDFITYQF